MCVRESVSVCKSENMLHECGCGSAALVQGRLSPCAGECVFLLLVSAHVIEIITKTCLK